MTAADILRKAKDHISDPAMWFQGNYTASLDDDWGRLPRKDEPCCGLGALAYSARGWAILENEKFLLNAARRRGFHAFYDFNDHPNTTHADVMAVFDEAIAIAEGE